MPDLMHQLIWSHFCGIYEGYAAYMFQRRPEFGGLICPANFAESQEEVDRKYNLRKAIPYTIGDPKYEFPKT